jgi:hypothetical protein
VLLVWAVAVAIFNLGYLWKPYGGFNSDWRYIGVVTVTPPFVYFFFLANALWKLKDFKEHF